MIFVSVKNVFIVIYLENEEFEYLLSQTTWGLQQGRWLALCTLRAVAVPCRMSHGTGSEDLRELLSACCRGDQVAALHTLGLHPGLINERWAGEWFDVAGGGWLDRGDTAIMSASRGGNEALVLELVKRGAEVNARGGNGFDALMYASQYGHTAVVAVLLNHGADPNTRSHSWTALGLAAA